MAWEARGKAAFYYRSVRGPDGRVRKEYLGRSPDAQQNADFQSAQKADQVAASALLAQAEPLLGVLDELENGIDAMVEAVLRVNGGHEHRGTWRKQRGQNQRESESRPGIPQW